MDVSTIVNELRQKGRVAVRDGSGKVVELIVPEHFDPQSDSKEAVFLLVDLFQIRGIAGQFSEIALDIIEFASKPTIYTSPASSLQKSGPIIQGNVRFCILKKGIWQKIVFGFSRPLVFQEGGDPAGAVEEPFPLFQKEVKKMFLTADGEVKIGE